MHRLGDDRARPSQAPRDAGRTAALNAIRGAAGRGGATGGADRRDYRIDARDLARRFRNTSLERLVPALVDAVAARGPALRHGDLPRWRDALARLPPVRAPSVRVEGPLVVADAGGDGDAASPDAVTDALGALHPWRKGPFRIDGVEIDTEWRSDRKWDRVRPHLSSLDGRSVLDVGCGSGYHLWRLREAGCAAALGIEPTLLYVHQFEAVARCAPDAPIACLPTTLEALATGCATGCEPPAFDTVLSMGVLYHRPDPHAHLAELLSVLRPGGELVLETLVPDRALDRPCEQPALEPAPGPRAAGRYARMGNVHPLPSLARLVDLLGDAGFAGARAVSLELTSTDEQRRTGWMRFESLNEALEPCPPGAEEDPERRTVEGLPRPARAVLIAHRPRAPRNGPSRSRRRPERPSRAPIDLSRTDPFLSPGDVSTVS